MLAAGKARRFGSQKLLAPLAGKPLVRHAVEHVLAASVDDVVVVLGSDAAAVREALDDLPVRFVINANYEAGMSTSLACGVRAVPESAAGVLIALGDLPAVTPEMIDRMIAAWHRSGKAIAVPVYGDVRGTPVLFASSVRPELLGITGDRGAQEVVASDPDRVVEVRHPGPITRDVDTPEDLAQARRQSERPQVNSGA